jgi:EmrB/QacA subfamily drug resistance transporter
MPTRHKGLALAVLALTQLMVVLDSSIVNVALPSVQSALDFSSTSLQWVVNAYTLVFGGFLLLGGRFADRLGRKRVFIAGLVLFAVASAIGGLANSSGVLLAARALQGLGGALMSPAALSLVTVIFTEGAERNKALGVWGAIAAGGAAIGVLLGGVLVEWLDWRWVFFVNLPIAALAIVGALRFVPESRDENAQGSDVWGAVTVTGGLMALVYALVRGNEVGWATAQTLGTFAASAALLVTFFVLQQKGSSPLMPLRVFESRNVVGANAGLLLLGASIFGMFFYISLYLQQILGYSAMKTGAAFLPVSIIIMLSAGIGSQMLTKFGPRAVGATGLAIAAVGMLLFIRIHPGGGYLSTILLPLAVIGIGMGPTFVSLTSGGVTGVPHEDAGVASALLNTSQQVGGAIGLAMLTAVSTARFDHLAPNMTDKLAIAGATTSGWTWGFGVCAGLLALGATLVGTVMNASKEDVAANADGAVMVV